MNGFAKGLPASGGRSGLLFSTRTRVHFVGIGGVGMCGIAEVLLKPRVPGGRVSDLRIGANARRLGELGAIVFEGHAAEQVDAADVVVVSSAVPADNPEVAAAAERQLPIIPRGEMLAELMRMKFAVAVAGSHGKTTTTSMTAGLLDHAGLDPTMVIGGRVAAIGGGARLGKSEILVAEADESDRTFLRLLPVVAVVTGIDREHLDAYQGMDDLLESFLRFLNTTPFYGAAIVCTDCENVRSLLPRVRRRVVTYGLSEGADVSAEKISIGEDGTRYELRLRRGFAGPVHLKQPRARRGAEQPRRRRGGRGVRPQHAGDPRRARSLRRSRAPVSASRRHRRNPDRGRLRPPSDRDPGNARRGAGRRIRPGRWRSSSRTATAGSRISSMTSATPSRTRTRLWSRTSTRRAKRRSPESRGRRWPRESGGRGTRTRASRAGSTRPRRSSRRNSAPATWC